MWRRATPLQVIIHPCAGGRYERTKGQAKMPAWNSIINICTRAKGLYSDINTPSNLSRYRADSTVIPMLPKATFTSPIQPYLGLARTRPPLTSAINTLLAIWYSSILSSCPNHLNTLWSAVLANSFCIPALLRTSLFLILSIRDIHSRDTVSTSHTRCYTITPSYRHFFAFIYNSLLLSTLFSALHANYPIYFVYHILFSSSISCHLRPQVLKTFHFFQRSPFSLTCIRSILWL